jgi:hypothetical protein
MKRGADGRVGDILLLGALMDRLLRRAVATAAVLAAGLALVPPGPGWAGRVTAAAETGQATFDLGPDAPQMFFGMVGGTVTVQGPLPDGTAPSPVFEATVDGGKREVIVSPAWEQLNWQDPAAQQTVDIGMAGSLLGVGTHQLTLRALDTVGGQIGAAITRTIVVQAPKLSVTAPKLVVGRQVRASVTAEAPVGQTMHTCALHLAGPGAPGASVGGELCPSATAKIQTTGLVVPQVSGRNSFSLSTWIGSRSGSVEQPAMVYAARRASVTAPTTTYGTTGTARVVVQDSAKTGVWQGAPAGIGVTLQRQAINDASPWVSIGAAKIGSGGIALIPFTSTINANFRAVLTSTVPGETVISPSYGVPSAAAVRWRSAPPTATRGKTVAFEVTAAPYDAGNVAHLQVRKPGTTTWTIVRSVAVPTTTIAHITWAFPSTGAWGVRVYRAPTAQHSGGLSPVITTTVR